MKYFKFNESKASEIAGVYVINPDKNISAELEPIPVADYFLLPADILENPWFSSLKGVLDGCEIVELGESDFTQ